MYKMLFLMSEGSAPSLEKLRVAIRKQFAGRTQAPKLSAVIKRNSMTVKVNGYPFFIGFSCEPHVLQESAEIAAKFGSDHPAREAIARVSCRFELGSGPDPNMDHFNDMIFICHAAESIGPAYIFNPRAREFA